MAIFHLNVKVVRRVEGRTSTAVSAYCAGEKIKDIRTGEIFDYRHKPVVTTGLLGWNGDRASLWNTAEQAEKKRNSVVARTVVVALPHELPESTRQNLVKDFASFLRQRHGVAVDWAIHPPPDDGDHRQHHAHLILTTRRVDEERFGSKTRELDRKPQSREHIIEWRRQWARLCNEALRTHGLSVTVDCRSHASKARALGIAPILPMRHLGATATHMLRHGIRTFLASENAQYTILNYEVLALRAKISRLSKLLADTLLQEEPASQHKIRPCTEL